MKLLEVRQKYSAARRISNSLLSVSSGDETLRLMLYILLVFSVTPFKIDQNKNQNRSIDKSGIWEMKGGKYTKSLAKIQARRVSRIRDIRRKCFTQINRDLYGDAMLVPTWMGTNMADGNQQKHLLLSFDKKACIYSSRNS